MARIYNEDATTIGFWFDENNGITNRPGIFKIMSILDENGYTEELGNPINIWKIPVLNTDEYKGIAYSELDYMYLARSSFKSVREYYLTRWVNTSLQPRYEAIQSITRMYSTKWIDLWDTMFYDYDPIENYNMREQLTNDQKTLQYGKIDTNTITTQYGKKDTNTITTQYGKKDTYTITGMNHAKTGTETDQTSDSSDEIDKIYGFDSVNGVNSNKKTITRSGSNTHQYNTQETDTGSSNNQLSGTDTESSSNQLSGSDTETSNNQLSGTDTETRNYVLTRKGNIGVTTSQQMIEQQRKLLMYNYFDDVVFPDIDNILTLSVY